MANARFYSSVAAVTALQVTAGPSDTSIQVASSTGFPGSFPFTLSLDYGAANEELVDVTAGGPSVFTVTRAVDGTSASTHNAGAVVRHVSSARDFTESRTHEAATTNVHGITGTFVDTTSAQTLTNKTLTSPTINSGALSGTFSGAHAYSGAVTFSAGGALTGTFTGNPTLSGNPVFSGNPNFTGTPTLANATLNGNYGGTPKFTVKVTSSRVAATDPALGVIYNEPTNTFDSYQIRADGRLEWGPGTGARDTFLYRNAVGSLRTEGDFFVADDLTVNDVTNTGSLVAVTAEAGTVSASTVGADTVINNTSLITYHPMQVGSELISFTSQTSFTQAVTFTTPFPSQPRMSINIASGSGNATRWGARAINVTTTGFTIFVFRGDNSDPAETWSNIPVHWIAVQP